MRIATRGTRWDGIEWRLAHSLITLAGEIGARWPQVGTIGTIGDRAHAATNSDHNPGPGGWVRAIDVPVTARNGVSGDALAEHLRGDQRLDYVIWNRRIASARHKWRWRPYNGRSAHTDHVHISCAATLDALNGTAGWGIAAAVAPPVPAAPESQAPPAPTTPTIPSTPVPDEEDDVKPYAFIDPRDGTRHLVHGSGLRSTLTQEDWDMHAFLGGQTYSEAGGNALPVQMIDSLLRVNRDVAELGRAGK